MQKLYFSQTSPSYNFPPTAEAIFRLLSVSCFRSFANWTETQMQCNRVSSKKNLPITAGWHGNELHNSQYSFIKIPKTGASFIFTHFPIVSAKRLPFERSAFLWDVPDDCSTFSPFLVSDTQHDTVPILIESCNWANGAKGAQTGQENLCNQWVLEQRGGENTA